MTWNKYLGRMGSLVLAAIVGCSAPRPVTSPDVTADAPALADDAFATIADAAVTLDAGRDAFATPCTSPEFGAIWGRLYDQRSFAPLAEVRVCVANRPALDCVTTNAAGEYTFQCVAAGDAEVTYEAAGYPSQRWAWSARSGTTEELSLGLLARADDAAFLAPTGETYPDGARSLVHVYFLGLAAGAVVTLRRGTGTPAFYTRYEGGTLDPKLSSLSSTAENAYLIAGPVSGEREIEITVTPGPSAASCGQLYGGWAPPDGEPNTARVPVEPGATSILFVRCE